MMSGQPGNFAPRNLFNAGPDRGGHDEKQNFMNLPRGPPGPFDIARGQGPIGNPLNYFGAGGEPMRQPRFLERILSYKKILATLAV